MKKAEKMMEGQHCLPETLVNITNGKKKPLQRGDILVRAVFTMEMTSVKFRTSTYVLRGMTRRERRKHLYCCITSLCGSTVISQLCFINIPKLWLTLCTTQKQKSHSQLRHDCTKW